MVNEYTGNCARLYLLDEGIVVMSRQEREIREKQQYDKLHQRQVRRNQIIFAVFSAFLILSMLISLIRW